MRHHAVALLVCLTLAVAQDLFLESPASHHSQQPIATGDDVYTEFTPAPTSPVDKIHVLWPKALPRPSLEDYESWYKKNAIEFVDEKGLPQLPPDSRVDVFFLSKPIFGLVGRATDIWHGALGFRVQDGDSYVFEFTSLDFMAAIVYPDANKTLPAANVSERLYHWPATAIVDYHTYSAGQEFAGWKPKLIRAVGETTGNGVNLFATWALAYGMRHPRYMVWRVLQAETALTLVESQQCFDFVFRGLRFLQGIGVATVNATSLPRTIVNVYAKEVATVPFDETVSAFFSSKKRVLAEFLEISGEIIHHPMTTHSTTWYWPAWFSPTSVMGGSSQIYQNVDYPKVYHRYDLTFPTKIKQKSMEVGVQRQDMPLN